MSLAWFFVIAAGALNSLGAFLLKKSQLTASSYILGLPVSGYLIGGGALFAATFVLYVYALKTLPVLIAYPVFVAISQGMLTVLALSILSERISLLQGIGILMIIVGTVLVTVTTRAQ
jgi:multidrug transporter EmrE-like cation transporter